MLFLPFAMCRKFLSINKLGSLITLSSPRKDILYGAFDHMNDYVRVSNAADNISYTQLAHGIPYSSGYIISKKDIKLGDFRSDFILNIEDFEGSAQGGAGMAFFFSKDVEFEKGSFYGLQGVLNGLVVFININSSTVGLINGENVDLETSLSKAKTAKVEPGLLKDNFILRVEQEQGNILVSIGKQNNFSNVLSTKFEGFKYPVHIGASAMQSNGISSFKLISTRLYNASYSNSNSEEGIITKRSRKMLFFIFVLVCSVVGYYLYCNYEKYK